MHSPTCLHMYNTHPLVSTQVIIYNRMDCCSNMLENVQVTVGDNEDGIRNELCGIVRGARGRNVLEVKCPSMLDGRYVTVLKAAKEALTLCEVKVMGVSSEAQDVIMPGQSKI